MMISDLLEMRIKLSSSNRPDDFLNELMQHEDIQTHPWNRNVLLYGPVGIEVSWFGNEIHLGDITTYSDHGQGWATRALGLLKSLADKYQVSISGTAKAYSSQPEHIRDTKRLLQWYQKQGFENLGGYPEDGYEIKYIPRVTEAPLGDYELIGDWDNPSEDKPTDSFKDAQDRKIVSNPKAIKKVRQKLGKTNHILNMYFVNQAIPALSGYEETGVVSQEWIQHNIPVVSEQMRINSDEIAIVWTNNWGLNKVPMTPWIMMHRLGHGAAVSERPIRGSGQITSLRNDVAEKWTQVEQSLRGSMISMLDRYQTDSSASPEKHVDAWIGNGDIHRIYEHMGTMKSAKSGGYKSNPYEFIHEMFAQYIITGKVTLNPWPHRFTLNKTTFEVPQKSNRDDINNITIQLQKLLQRQFEVVLYALHGKVVVI